MQTMSSWIPLLRSHCIIIKTNRRKCILLQLRRSACRKRDIISSKCTRTKFLYYACFFLALTTEEEIGPRSGRAGPSFSVRPEKEAKGAVLHGTSAAAKWSHDRTRSANLPKLSCSRGFRHMGRFVFALWAKIPSRATQSDPAGAASASRRRPAAHKNTGYENDQKPC